MGALGAAGLAAVDSYEGGGSDGTGASLFSTIWQRKGGGWVTETRLKQESRH